MREKPGFIEQMKNKLFSKESEPPMVPGEIFNPEKELAEIKKLPHEERKQAVEEFKEKLAYQKEGLAETQTKLIELIRQNPDAFLEELNDKALELGFKYDFSENQQLSIRFILEACMEKHRQVRELRTSYPDDKELFKVIFGREPKGQVEVIEGPIILYFRLHDNNDYALVRRGVFRENRDVTDEDIKQIEKSRGTGLPGFIINHKGQAMVLENIICAEKARGTEFNEERQATFRHEEQHQVERLLTDLNMLPVWRAENDEVKEMAWRNFLQDRRRRFESRSKDEILAFLRGGNRNQVEIFEVLTHPQEQGGAYDFLEKFGVDDKDSVNKFPEVFRPTALKILEEVYDRNSYNKTITDGLIAYIHLVKGGYSKEMAINLLSTEPLAKWPLVVKRMLEVKK